MTCPWREPTVKDLINSLQKHPNDNLVEISCDRGYTTIDDPDHHGYTKNVPDDITTITIKIKSK